VVGVGPSMCRGRGVPLRMLAELAQLMRERAVSTIGDMIGLAHPEHHKARLEVDVNQ
jgi:hypothetical protein